jgi:phosphomannomutase
MISLAANKLNCELGVIFTASHNPPSYNGYKLKSKHGGPLVQKYITEVENLIPEKYEVKEHSLETLGRSANAGVCRF